MVSSIPSVNPNLAKGQGGSSVLSAYSGESSLFPQLQSKSGTIEDKAKLAAGQRFTELKSQIDETYKQTSDAIQAETDRWITVKASVNNINATIQTNQDSIKKISDELLTLRTTVSDAGEPGIDQKFQAGKFNGSLNTINFETDKIGKSFNLIGSIDKLDFTPNQVEYRHDLGAGVTKLNGTYTGTDYRIKASDGTYWIPDLTANTLTQYSELQGVKQQVTVSEGGTTIKLDKAASYANGVKLISYDDKTQDVTIQVTINPSDPPITVTGKLEKAGIGLMPAWFYDNLRSNDGRTRAHAAVDEAVAQLGLASAQLRGPATTVIKDGQKIDAALAALNEKNQNALKTQLTSEQDLQTKYQQQVQVMQANLAQARKEQQNYLDAFSSAIGSDSLLSILI